VTPPVDAAPPPRVSIGLPVYNGERYLAEAIESALGQTFGDLELVISDNASTDGTREICERYAERDRRVRYCREAENRGAGYNFQRVADLARGEYFKWLAADDCCHPQLLERSVEALDAAPDAAAVYPKAWFIDAAGRRLFTSDDVFTLAPWPEDRADRVRRLLEGLYHDGSMAMVTMLGVIRTDTLRQCRPFGNYRGADCTVVTELALRGELRELPEQLNFFRRHAAADSAHGSAKLHQHFYDPSVRNRALVSLQHRRWRLEVLRAVASSSLGLAAKARLLSWSTLDLSRKAGGSLARAIR
jgi:hypothetical protein